MFTGYHHVAFHLKDKYARTTVTHLLASSNSHHFTKLCESIMKLSNQLNQTNYQFEQPEAKEHVEIAGDDGKSHWPVELPIVNNNAFYHLFVNDYHPNPQQRIFTIESDSEAHVHTIIDNICNPPEPEIIEDLVDDEDEEADVGVAEADEV